MRIDPVHFEYFKASIRRFLPDAELYLFGSRAKDDLKGGDIDLLIIGDRELTDQEKRDIKIGFYKTFKIDAANLAEKLEVVEHADILLNIGELRNQIAHELSARI